MEMMIKVFLKYLLGLTLFFLMASVLAFFILRNSYNNWTEDFLSANVMILNLSEDMYEIEESLESKIFTYNADERDNVFIQITTEESLLLFSKALSESFPDLIEVTHMGLIPYRGNWFVYVKSEMYSVSLPWFGFNLRKDDVQSIDIYIEDVFLGNMSFKKLFLESFVEEINRGINRSLRLVNDGNFAGRIFENIELTEEYLVIRSRKISF